MYHAEHTQTYTRSLPDARPIPESAENTEDFASASRQRRFNANLKKICLGSWIERAVCRTAISTGQGSSPRSLRSLRSLDRKSTRLNSSHANISYAVFCLTIKSI